MTRALPTMSAYASHAALEAACPPMRIADIVESCARLGERTAIEVFATGERIDYAGLVRETNRIGTFLRARGVGVGSRVALMMPNRLAYPLCWLALARIGAVHVPINVRYTSAEIGYVATDADVMFAIVDATLIETFARMPERPVGLADDRIIVVGDASPTGLAAADAEAAADADAVSANDAADSPADRFERLEAALGDTAASPCTDPSVKPESLVNIQYTSGTTGLPKGCMLSQDYWTTLARVAGAWDAVPATRLLSAQPWFYMDPQWILLKGMLNGATVVIAPGLSSSRFIGWLQQHRIDWCLFPLLMTRQPPSKSDTGLALRQVATFGWSGDVAAAFERRFGALAREGFGMTEIGMGTCLRADDTARAHEGSVGRAAPFREASLRDGHGREVAPGTEGELWIRGRSIFDGYWRRPEANAQALPGDGWFRTGDLFRSDADGYLWLVGRLKDMIRRSSENIAAREVEAAITSHPGVEDAACVPVPDEIRGEEVKAYVQLKPGIDASTVSPAALLAHVSPLLAAFKRPRYIGFVDDFPRTASNKIEKRSLVAGVHDLRLGAWDAAAAGGQQGQQR